MNMVERFFADLTQDCVRAGSFTSVAELVEAITVYPVLVSAIVVGNQVEVDGFGSLAVDLLEEAQPLHVRGLLFGAVDQLALQVAQRSEQRDGAVPDVIVCLRPDMAAAQPQARLRALQGLALRLLVAAQHQ